MLILGRDERICSTIRTSPLFKLNIITIFIHGSGHPGPLGVGTTLLIIAAYHPTFAPALTTNR